mmetsp:Transcript_11138/g.33356  ORF Transcript_11138/g.33356 Transcript_11138/m.33356 type:complete len:264 (-) Transcript_11138:398-1189(-)
MVGWGCEMDDARSTTHPASTGASVIKHMPSADNASSHCKSPWSDPVTVAHFSRRSDWSVVTAAPSAGTAAETIEQSSTLPGVQLPIGGNCSKRCSASHALQNLETVPSFAQCIANVAPSSQTLNLRAAHGGANIAVSIATFWPDSGSKIVGQLCRSHDVFTSRTRWRCDTPGPSNTNDKAAERRQPLMRHPRKGGVSAPWEGTGGGAAISIGNQRTVMCYRMYGIDRDSVGRRQERGASPTWKQLERWRLHIRDAWCMFGRRR